MNQVQLKLKACSIRWHKFSRRSDAIFMSLHREISIGILTVATLTFATPQNSVARTVMGETAKSEDAGIKLDDIEVTATRVSMPLEQTARFVSVMTREDINNCPAQSISDLLKHASGVDVRQRGAYGIQTDISIDGGTHDQIVILINGVNISSPHTGHLAADFPFNIEDIERIEILEGAASRVYGSSAYSGAINIVTRGIHKTPEKSHSDGYLSLSGGSFGTIKTNSAFSLTYKNLFNNISLGFTRSDGGVSNSDFKRFNGFYYGGVSTKEADFRWQLGLISKNYGANTFYSGKFPNQYEENSNYTTSISVKTKGRIQIFPSIYWNRAHDHYQLIRGMSPTQENYHMTDVYGATINAQTKWLLGITAIGAEFRNEGILSTALGKQLSESEYVKIGGTDRNYTKKDNRTNICYYLEHDITLRQISISLGLMTNMNTWLDHRYRLYPGVDVSYRITNATKLFAAWNMAQRMPTFTDIYYKSPTQVGYAGLKPERTSEFNIGGVFRNNNIELALRIYHRHQTNMIDWVIPSDSIAKYGRGNYTTYHATNLKVNNMGISFSGRFTTNNRRYTLNTQYTFIHQKRNDDIQLDDSYYGLNYLRHKVVAAITARICKGLSATLSYRFQDRMGTYYEYDTSHTVKNAYGWDTYTFAGKSSYKPFSLFDLHFEWKEKHYKIYADLNNLTNYRYIDIGNVKQPGFSFIGGIKLNL